MTTISSELAPLVPPAVPATGRPVWMERQWVAIDGMGTVRNGMGVASDFVGSVSKVGQVLGTVIPAFQIAGGLLISYNAARYTIPNSWNEFKELDPADTEGKLASGMGFVNQLFFGSFGPALAVAGATGVASLLTSGAVSSALLQASEITAYGALGGLCVARGLLMATRSAYNLSYLIPFHSDFREALSNGRALQFLKDEMKSGEGADWAAFKRRVGDSAADEVKLYMEGGSGKKPEEIIRIVDKGIFKQKCKQYLTLSIAIFMIIGGVASLVFSGGLTGLAIAAIIGVSFMLMEAEWLLFDKTDWFNAFVDNLYEPLPEIPVQNIPQLQQATVA